MIYDKEVTSFNSGTGSSSTSGSSSDSVSGLKFELSLSFRSHFDCVDVKSYNEVINIVGSKVRIVEGRWYQ